MNNSKFSYLNNDPEHQLLFNLFLDQNFNIDYSSLNYDRLYLLIARKHRIINYFLEKAETNLFPKDFIIKLKDFQVSQKQRSLKQLSILIDINKILKDYDILFIKGLPLSQELYDDFAYRDSSDIDLLVRPEDEKEIIKLLSENHFEKHHNYEHHFVMKSNSISIEIHRKLSAVFNTKDIEIDIWKNYYQIKINNYQFNTLNKINHYKYLLINGTTHYWNRLSWVIDYMKFKEQFVPEKLDDEFQKLTNIFEDVFLYGKSSTFEQKFILKSILENTRNNNLKSLKRAYYFSKISNYSLPTSFFKSFQRMIKK